MATLALSVVVGSGAFVLASLGGLDTGTMFSAQLAMFASIWPVLLRHERQISEVTG